MLSIRDDFRDEYRAGRREEHGHWVTEDQAGTFQNKDMPVTEEEAEEIRRRLSESLRSAPHVVLPSEMPAPPQPVRPPAFSPRHTYGGKGTIHRTGTVDIQQDEAGNVVAVWFRCMSLPFRCSSVDETEQTINPMGIAIEEITYVDLPREESSQ